MCKFCGKRFNGQSDLIIHEKLHDNNLKKCYFCPWRGVPDHKKPFEIHFDKHIFGPKLTGRYPCDFCAKKFDYPHARKRHVEHLHEKVNDRYKCEKCDFSTYAYFLLYAHRSEKH